MKSSKIFIAALGIFSLQLTTASAAKPAVVSAQTKLSETTAAAPKKTEHHHRHHMRHRPHRHKK